MEHIKDLNRDLGTSEYSQPHLHKPPSIMAYAQYIIIILHNVGNGPMKVKNVSLSWGKFHADGNKDKEISKDEIEGKVIGPDEKFQINSSGRSDASSGTEGSFDLVDVNDNNKTIRHFYWDCPWGSKVNTWTVNGSNSKWMVEHQGANLYGGAIGTVTSRP
ncbi:Aegerolysin Aa-Pri1 [Paramarasmius palmivorus]|uniref:Aegerolysin Aa-Pri1 n=1 Tax=Paramarasmius palmivorus TaxID=297713 RepID=A0AAW0DPF7_9AGAR